MSLISETDLAVRAIAVSPREMVFVRDILEASEGVGILVAERGGNALLLCPLSQQEVLDELLCDLAAETTLVVRQSVSAEEVARVAR